MSTADILLEASGLTTSYSSGRGQRNVAVDNVDLEIYRGETVGLVGESGSGKSTLARTLVGLEKPDSGSITFDGRDLLGMSARQRRGLSSEIQMIFQDPSTSLNPRLNAFQIVTEAWSIRPRNAPPKSEWRSRCVELVERVGLRESHLDRLPHQFSGGQRQRLGIARALATDPKLIICDEPVSALDVSVQAQVLNLLVDLQRDFGLTYLFISHDLSVVRYISDRIAVMNKGELVEVGDSEAVFQNPSSDYTQRLLAAIPRVRPWARPQPQHQGATQ